MPLLRVHNLTVSLDGFAAGPDQDLEHPLGVGGEQLHRWMFATPSAARLETAAYDPVDQPAGLDDEHVARYGVGVGAFILGRNMFGPVRGPWPDENWRGWWGEQTPYRKPVIVLTHHPREAFELPDGTRFEFVTDGIEAALERAFAAAGGEDVILGGGPSTIRQYLRAGLVDELHVAVVPVLLDRGERLLGDLGSAMDGYEIVEFAGSPAALHVRFVRKS
jgi:dihydrofolate reductase